MRNEIEAVMAVMSTALIRAEGDKATVAALLNSALVIWSKGELGRDEATLVKVISETPCPMDAALCKQFCIDVARITLDVLQEENAKQCASDRCKHCFRRRDRHDVRHVFVEST